MEKLILIGAGGYAKSVLDSVDYFNYDLIGFLDEFSSEKEHLGYPIVANSLASLENSGSYVFFISIGNNGNRKRWFDRLRERKLRIINVVDKSAIVSPKAQIGDGCFVGKMAVINAGVTVGDNCIINTKSLVEHGCSVSDHVNLSTNAVLNGDVKVGCGTFVGSGSITVGQCSIGEWSTVGAGAVVTKDIRDHVTVVGVPAKEMKKDGMPG